MTNGGFHQEHYIYTEVTAGAALPGKDAPVKSKQGRCSNVLGTLREHIEKGRGRGGEPWVKSQIVYKAGMYCTAFTFGQENLARLAALPNQGKGLDVSITGPSDRYSLNDLLDVDTPRHNSIVVIELSLVKFNEKRGFYEITDTIISDPTITVQVFSHA